MAVTDPRFPRTIGEALTATRRILSSSPELTQRGTVDAEAEILVNAAFVLSSGKSLSRLELYSRSQEHFPQAAAEELIRMAEERRAGRLLQHLTGRQAFLDHEYEVGPQVLIPRPETEVLASVAISELSSLEPRLGLEIGIGSGVLSIELLHRFPGLEMIASELIPEAAVCARRNAIRILGPALEKARLEILQSSAPTEVLEVFERHPGAFRGRRADFIISNPPYLALTDDIDREVLEHEPSTALFPPSPQFFYREIAERSEGLLNPGAVAFLEVPTSRAVAIESLFRENCWDTRLIQDLTGRDRVLVARLGLR